MSVVLHLMYTDYDSIAIFQLQKNITMFYLQNLLRPYFPETGADFDLCTNFIVTFSTICNLFLYCYFGKMATECYAMMSSCLFESNWMELPVNLKKFFILMIQNSHRVHLLSWLWICRFGFGNILHHTYCVAEWKWNVHYVFVRIFEF